MHDYEINLAEFSKDRFRHIIDLKLYSKYSSLFTYRIRRIRHAIHVCKISIYWFATPAALDSINLDTSGAFEASKFRNRPQNKEYIFCS